MPKPFARKFYKSKEWQGIRDNIIKRDNYLCVMCGNPAEEVHHKTFLNSENITDAKVSVNADNLISVCRDCHFNIHREQRIKAITKANKEGKSDLVSGYEFDCDGNVVPTPPYSGIMRS